MRFLLSALILLTLFSIPWLLWLIYKKVLRKNKKLTLIIATSVVLISLTVTGIVTANILSERETFSSKEDMLEYLNGVWCTDDNEKRLDKKLVIDDGDISLYSYIWHSQGSYNIDHEIKEIKLYPRRGYFIISTTSYDIKFIINSNGEIIDTNDDLLLYKQ